MAERYLIARNILQKYSERANKRRYNFILNEYFNILETTYGNINTRIPDINSDLWQKISTKISWDSPKAKLFFGNSNNNVKTKTYNIYHLPGFIDDPLNREKLNELQNKYGRLRPYSRLEYGVYTIRLDSPDVSKTLLKVYKPYSNQATAVALRGLNVLPENMKRKVMKNTK